jgi:hypothetical protein
LENPAREYGFTSELRPAIISTLAGVPPRSILKSISGFAADRIAPVAPGLELEEAEGHLPTIFPAAECQAFGAANLME